MLIFGTARLHRTGMKGDRRNLLKYAAGRGFSCFDTAPSYCMGLVESDLGMVFGNNEDILINTKVGIHSNRLLSGWIVEAAFRKKIWRRHFENLHFDFSVRAVLKSAIASTVRLKKDYLDGLYLHEPFLAALSEEEIYNLVRSLRPIAAKLGLAGRIPKEAISDNLADLIVAENLSLQTHKDDFFNIPVYLRNRVNVYGFDWNKHSLQKAEISYPQTSIIYFSGQINRIKVFSDGV